MVSLNSEQMAALPGWFLPERPGPLVGSHVLLTGHGAVWADRWPAPRALLAEVAGNYSLSGDAAALRPADLPPLAGFIEAPAPFVPLLRAACPGLVDWLRVITALPSDADIDRERFTPPPGALVRPLALEDAGLLAGLSPDLRWISNTWGGPAGLAGSGRVWGALIAGRLVSVAGTFFAGWQYEDVGVATEPAFRRQGLNAACAAAVCRDIRARGCTPSWSTSVDNPASLGVAEKLGFVRERMDWLYVMASEVS